MNEYQKSETITFDTRQRLAGKVFNLTSAYDAAISQFLLNDNFPDYLNSSYKKSMDLRYGENPHQKAAFYTSTVDSGAMKDFKQLHGKELSFNNIRDMDSAWKIVSEFSETVCVGVKHSTPCGVATGNDVLHAWQRAYACDQTSIYGGIVAFNKEVDDACATSLSEIFLEIVIAPSFSNKALGILKQKKNLRIIQMFSSPQDKIELVKVDGGMLVQNRDNIFSEKFRFVTKRTPTEIEFDNMLFGQKVVKHVKSNAIVVIKDKMAKGIGGGQVNRIWATREAIERAGDGIVLSSDAYFPFDDVIEECHKAGITAIMQPGGSINDELVIAKANQYDIAMVFTNIRHFKH
jgi:phosphoribosylaminoimidazolecarboxamide formyltransferase/IMP cyclohydrolase